MTFAYGCGGLYHTHQFLQHDYKFFSWFRRPSNPHSMIRAAVLLLATTFAFATLDGPCTVGSTPGICITTSSCLSSGGTSHPGYCPNDPTSVQCCTKTCGSGGICQFSSTCTGTTKSSTFLLSQVCHNTD